MVDIINQKTGHFSIIYDLVPAAEIDTSNMPLGTIFVDNNYQKIIDDLENKFGNKYDPSCYCISYIDLTAHSGIPGNINLGTDLFFNITSVNNILNWRRTHAKSLRVLDTIKKYLCKDQAEVRFSQCKVALGDDGQELLNFLAAYFGGNTTVSAPKENVAWCRGFLFRSLR